LVTIELIQFNSVFLKSFVSWTQFLTKVLSSFFHFPTKGTLNPMNDSGARGRGRPPPQSGPIRVGSESGAGQSATLHAYNRMIYMPYMSQADSTYNSYRYICSQFNTHQSWRACCHERQPDTSARLAHLPHGVSTVARGGALQHRQTISIRTGGLTRPNFRDRCSHLSTLTGPAGPARCPGRRAPQRRASCPTRTTGSSCNGIQC